MSRWMTCLLLLPVCSVCGWAQGQRLLRQPDISAAKVVFLYAGDIWTAPRAGGQAERLTRTAEAEAYPRFSPDGRQIAFTRGGDVFLISTAGGEERRLTWHPQFDRPAGWTPDGRHVLVHSMRWAGNLTSNPHLFLVPAAGGSAGPLPIPRASYAAFSPDGSAIAYGPNVEMALWQLWKGYRGGSLGYIALYQPGSNRYEELPRLNANDVYPMWDSSGLYFASDRDGTMNLFRYDLSSRKTTQLTDYAEWDVKHPNLGAGAITYENDGWLHLLDLKTRRTSRLVVETPPEARPPAEDSARWLQALEDVWRAYQSHAFRPAASWPKQKDRYLPWMRAAAHSSDAEYVLREMLAEAGQSHVTLAPPPAPPNGTGLAGLDFRVESGRCVISKIYRGHDRDEKQRGPLFGAGVNEGDVLVKVNGEPTGASRDIYSWFAGLAGKTVTLTIERDGVARDVQAVLGGDERALRYHEWVQANRRQVERSTGGRVGYIHVPNVEPPGVELFQAQWKEQRGGVAAMIVDVRNNGGGTQPLRIFEWIDLRPRWLMYSNKGLIPPSASQWLDGPKVMIVNDQAGSGGDQLPMLMRQSKTGPVVGTRTVGAFIGNGGAYKIAGGWTLMVPEYGFYLPGEGRWSPENTGIEPDYRVEMRAGLCANGADPRLGKAIEIALGALTACRKAPVPPPYVPAR
jgi:hypothetical protein